MLDSEEKGREIMQIAAADVMERVAEIAGSDIADEEVIPVGLDRRVSHLATLLGNYAATVERHRTSPTHGSQREALKDLAAGAILVLCAHDTYTL